jgi:hypothetical protein
MGSSWRERCGDVGSIAIIVTSALSVVERTLLPQGAKFISKPYDAGQISDALHSLAA